VIIFNLLVYFERISTVNCVFLFDILLIARWKRKDIKELFMDEILLVATTFETKQEAKKMAAIVLDNRLAGCAQITGPATSLYWWQGNIENAQEYILTFKSISSLYEKLERIIKENHPYDTPEIVATMTSHCSREYKEWLDKELRDD